MIDGFWGFKKPAQSSALEIIQEPLNSSVVLSGSLLKRTTNFAQALGVLTNDRVFQASDRRKQERMSTTNAASRTAF